MYKIGDILKFDYEHDGLVEEGHLFILAKTFESDFAFQIICIKGYHSGKIEGYVRYESEGKEKVSKEHLVQELNRAFIKIHWDTFEDSVDIKTR